MIKVVSAKHLSNKGQNKFSKKPSKHGNILNQLRQTYWDWSSQADHETDNWIEVIHVLIKTNVLCQFKRNILTHASIFTRFDINILEKHAWELTFAGHNREIN